MHNDRPIPEAIMHRQGAYQTVEIAFRDIPAHFRVLSRTSRWLAGHVSVLLSEIYCTYHWDTNSAGKAAAGFHHCCSGHVENNLPDLIRNPNANEADFGCSLKPFLCTTY